MMPWKITAGITEYLGLVTGYFPSKAILFINRTTGMVEYKHIYKDSFPYMKPEESRRKYGNTVD